MEDKNMIVGMELDTEYLRLFQQRRRRRERWEAALGWMLKLTVIVAAGALGFVLAGCV